MKPEDGGKIATDEIKIGVMTRDLILWRCLHGGPLTEDTLMRWKNDGPMLCMDLYRRNGPLLTKLTQTYGACAALARHGDGVVGHLRFYPKVIAQMCMSDQEGFCMQQQFPHGPKDDFAQAEFPAFAELEDKTLTVHCLMTGSPSQKENPYQRKGLERAWSGF